MKHIGTPLLLVLLLNAACAQNKDEITTFILVRHAEKADDGTDNPGLTEQGQARAEKLAEMFKDTPLSAIYATNFKRTQNTVKPIAEIQNLDVQPYEAMKPEVVKEMIEKHRGGTVLVSGHSNTTPWTANLLMGEEVLKDYPESEYGILLILAVADNGRVASITRVNY